MTDDRRMDLAHQFHYDIRNTTEESDDDVLLEAVRGKEVVVQHSLQLPVQHICHSSAAIYMQDFPNVLAVSR